MEQREIITRSVSASFPFRENPEQAALRNALILDTIIQYLDLTSRKTCRLLNKTWKRQVSQIMLKEDQIKISLVYYEGARKFYHVNVNHFEDRPAVLSMESNKCLTALNECLENSDLDEFPCSSYSFQRGNLGLVSCQNFFSIMGSHIKTLALEDSRTQRTPKNVFQKILLEQAPFVSKLKLGGFSYKWKDSEHFSLPHLKCLNLEYSFRECETINELLRASCNLQTCEHFHPDLTALLQDNNKMHTIKRFGEGINVCSTREFCDKVLNFSSSHPTLIYLNLDDHGRHFNDDITLEDRLKLALAWNKIMQSSKDSLKQLVMPQYSYHHFLTVPKLIHLKKLTLCQETVQRMLTLSYGMDFPELFPNLKTLSLSMINNNGLVFAERQSPLSQNQCQFTTVETLEINVSCEALFTPSRLYNLCSLCPNFRKLVLSSDHSPELLIPTVCRELTLLEQLTIIAQKECTNLDSAITGIPKTKCLQLRKSLRKKFTKDELQENPSICDIKGLRNFHIHLKDYGSFTYLPHKYEFEPLSVVSGIYAFKLMENLKVRISYDHYLNRNASKIKAALKSIAPYVNIVHIGSCEIY